MATDRPRIVVLGGLAIDLRLEVRALPSWGEAVQADSFTVLPGGKGLNQAVAAARLGADVAMIGAVGSDAFGDQLLQLVTEERISTEFIRRVEGTRSGICAVLVSYDADAAFLGWTNEQELGLGPADIDRAAAAIAACDAMLLTLEPPLPAIEHAVSIARQHRVKVVLNPAPPLKPPHRISHLLLEKVDAVIPNAWEAGELLGVHTGEEPHPIDPRSLATRLGSLMRPDGVACVTIASRGCVVSTRGRIHEFPGFPTNPTDTTGGSDAFCAAYAMAVARGKALEDAVTEANAAGSIVVGGMGGATAMPAADDVHSFLRARRRSNAT